jgi:hypothetical protein
MRRRRGRGSRASSLAPGNGESRWGPAGGPHRVRAEELETLVASFEACTLPRSEWTHRAHLSVALSYLTRHSPEEATRRIREAIQRYNRAHGIAAAPEGGYHETLTLFWIHVVREHISRSAPGEPIERIWRTLLEFAGDKSLPFEHYTRERLFSAEARAGWVEPDLKPLRARAPGLGA